MIGVSSNPILSSCSRIARTRPSIMSLGATRSAPASAWLAADRARGFKVGSVKIFAPLVSRPRKKRQHPYLRAQPRLAHESAQSRRLAQSGRAIGGKLSRGMQTHAARLDERSRQGNVVFRCGVEALQG